jgi:iron complex outermembrane receptor protein
MPVLLGGVKMIATFGQGKHVVNNLVARPGRHGAYVSRSVLLATALAFYSTPVMAQAVVSPATPSGAVEAENSRSTVGEIVVTAQKVAQNLQKTPLSISAVDSQDLARRNVVSANDLQLPNVTFGQFKSDSQITIRGIGNDNLTIGGDPGVAFHQDGVYLTRGALVSGGFFDIDRVEVLRGPQGTLYGRNAVAGVVNVITTKPTDKFEGMGDITYGNYNNIRVRAAINIPLSDTLAARVSGTVDQHDGYVLNTFTGNKIEDSQFYGVRGLLAYRPDANYDLLFAVVNEHRRGSGLIRRLLTPQTSPEIIAMNPEPDPGDPWKVSHNDDDKEIVDHTGVSLTANFNFGGAKLRSITAYNTSRTFQFLDLDDTSANYVKVSRDDRDRTFTQELQLNGRVADRVDWIVGAFYMDSHVFNNVPYNLVPVGQLLLEADQKLQAYAGFAQLTWSVTDSFRLTAGIRYSHERKKLFEQNTYAPAFFGLPSTALPVVVSRNTVYTNGAWTPHFGAEYDISQDVLAYASVTRGFKSGGFNASSFAPSYEPEFVWSYEAGLKSTFFDRRLRANLSVFHYNYGDLQVTAKQPGDLVFTITNAASAKVDGVELELVAVPVDGLRIDATIGYLDAHYESLTTADATRPGLGTLDLAGFKLPRSPTWKGSVGIEYAYAFAAGAHLTPRVDMNFQSVSYFTPFNVASASQPAYAKLNASLNYEPADANWRITAFVKNLTNKSIISGAIVSQQTSVNVYEGFYEPPRTYGATLAFKF